MIKKKQWTKVTVIWCHCDRIKTEDNVTPHHRVDKGHIGNNEKYP